MQHHSRCGEDRVSRLFNVASRVRGLIDVVAAGNVAGRPLPEGVEHAIDLEPDAKPPIRLLYHLRSRARAKEGWLTRAVC